MFAAFGEAAQDVMLQIKLMPMLVLAAQICPDSIEGTLFAFIMGVLNHISTTVDFNTRLCTIQANLGLCRV
jgi:hypothetical protein|eukprot:COSAG02_NODE_1188_length_14002_cov_10.571244_9_plen_71_part_00